MNAKQASAPREAAIAVVKLINQRDPQIAELAIALLDNLVKNCGYPFQLQISRKKFLNELVKKFPEKPPMRYSRIQRLILAQIEEWYQTICRTSKYKTDFGYIKDMHRLLTNKGYVFPEVKIEDAAVLNPSDNLKSLEDLQKEEAIVHSAKLQELIRRGNPQDLQEANKLMKIMAGFKDDHLEEKKQQIVDDVARLKRKVEILAEILNSIHSSNSSLNDTNEAAIELYSSIKSSQPRIKKIIEEQNEDEDKVHELLSLNDAVNQVIEKFQLLKTGKTDEASKISINSASVSNNDNTLNLIDFDDDAPISNDASGRDDKGYNDLLADLSNLAFTDDGNGNNGTNLFGSGGSIAIGGSDAQHSYGVESPRPLVGSVGGGNSLDLLSGLSSNSPQLQSNLKSTNQLDPFNLAFPDKTPNEIHNAKVVKLSHMLHSSQLLKIDYDVYNNSNSRSFKGRFVFDNLQATPLDKIKFLIAVPKACKLSLQPQSGDQLNGFAKRGITQEFEIDNNLDKPLKVKWKVEYESRGISEVETGVSVLEE